MPENKKAYHYDRPVIKLIGCNLSQMVFFQFAVQCGNPDFK